jgi:hypothetical protein
MFQGCVRVKCEGGVPLWGYSWELRGKVWWTNEQRQLRIEAWLTYKRGLSGYSKRHAFPSEGGEGAVAMIVNPIPGRRNLKMTNSMPTIVNPLSGTRNLKMKHGTRSSSLAVVRWPS